MTLPLFIDLLQLPVQVCLPLQHLSAMPSLLLLLFPRLPVVNSAIACIDRRDLYVQMISWASDWASTYEERVFLPSHCRPHILPVLFASLFQIWSLQCFLSLFTGRPASPSHHSDLSLAPATCFFSWSSACGKTNFSKMLG